MLRVSLTDRSSPRDFLLAVCETVCCRALSLLQFASFSLSFLFKHYCNENLIKKYQLADWRIRPLPEGMLNYARSDTHSLLYIFDRLRNDLIKRDGVELLKQAFEESRKVSLVRFEAPVICENSYLALIMRNRVKFNNRQRQAFKEIYSWRDYLARLEDECTNYILPNHMMLKIAEVLPQEQQGILACCNPIPAAVKKHLNELHLIILKARELPLDRSNDNVYLLKPIVNQLIDITFGMDILDEEHAEHHQVRHDCLLDTPEMLHQIKLSRTKREEASGLISFFTSAEPREVVLNEAPAPIGDYPDPDLQATTKKRFYFLILSHMNRISNSELLVSISNKQTNNQNSWTARISRQKKIR